MALFIIAVIIGTPILLIINSLLTPQSRRPRSWDKKPSTELQHRQLIALDYYKDAENLSRGEAADLIEQLKHDRANRERDSE